MPFEKSMPPTLFGHFLLGSHNFMLTARGLCVKWNHAIGVGAYFRKMLPTEAKASRVDKSWFRQCNHPEVEFDDNSAPPKTATNLSLTPAYDICSCGTRRDLCAESCGPGLASDRIPTTFLIVGSLIFSCAAHWRMCDHHRSVEN